MDNTEIAVFGGGCFWCTEAIFRRLRGVVSVESGYTGGKSENPTYEQVSQGNTGHVESIRVTFKPDQIKYADLLNVFFATHDPTAPDRQGNDVGPQYQSMVFYDGPAQKDAAEKYIQKLESEKIFGASIVTGVRELGRFWPAESYHQRFYEANRQHPYCQAIINPKISKLRQKFTPLLKTDAE